MKEKYLKSRHTLVLNADFRPFNIVNWEKSFVKSYFEPFSFSVVEVYDRIIHDSKGNEYPVPSVVSLKEYRQHHKAKLTKKNIFTRDRFECQYCGSRHDLTIDHVIPRSAKNMNIKINSWENLVTACRRCNHAKGDLMPDQFTPPKNKPRTPTKSQLLNNVLSICEIPTEWEQYIERT